MVSHLQTWVSHCKKWANEHNCKYSQALKSTECRDSYKNRGSGSSETTNEVKPKRKYTRKIKTEAEPTQLPQEVLNVIQKRKSFFKVGSLVDLVLRYLLRYLLKFSKIQTLNTRIT